MSLREILSGKPETEKPALQPRKPLTPARAPLPLQGTAKSKHPEFTQITAYVRKATKKAAQRKWEDEDGGDFSELLEQLMRKYVND